MPPVAFVQVTLPVAIVPPAIVLGVASDEVVMVVSEPVLVEVDEHPASTATRPSGSKMDSGRSTKLRVALEVMAISTLARPGIFRGTARRSDPATTSQDEAPNGAAPCCRERQK